MIVASGLLVAASSFTARGSRGGEATLAETRSGSPLFSRTAPARNPVRLRLIPDQRKVLGWVSGAGDRTGDEVLIAHGESIESAVIQSGNTFTWPYSFEEDTVVEFRIDDLRESITLGPRSVTPPSAFFVVDRPVHRPGQKLRFVAFLRQLDDDAAERGGFRPLAGRAVDVELRSTTTKTLAARIPLVSDDTGRIAGEYRFVDADPHDDYVLEVNGYEGSATVRLAEFRKSKVKLEIEGTLVDAPAVAHGDAVRRLRLTFSAVDFLGEPVSGSRVHYRAMVVSESENDRETPGLNARDFAHASKGINGLTGLGRLDETEALLLEGGAGVLPGSLHRGALQFASFEADLTLDSGRAETTLDLEKEWIEEGCVVKVHGVLVDENGREERALVSVTLEEERPSRVRLSLPKRSFGMGESIPVEVEVEDESGAPVDATTTLVLMKLSPPSGFHGYGYGYYGYYPLGYSAYPYGYNELRNAAGWHASYAWRGARRAAPGRLPGAVTAWRPGATRPKVDREITTALPLPDGRGALSIDEPGAYRVKVIARFPNGEQLEDEASCVVLPPEALPRLALQLDRTRYRPGDPVTGEVHSRFEDARLLLTVRDARGIRLWRTIRMRGSRTPLDIPLPKDLVFGAVIGVEYVSADGIVNFDAEPIQVPPDDRVINITTRMPDVVEPGATVELELEVDRRREVDLVVSVYDQSLLGIAPDRGVDIRDFYLADDRARESMAVSRLERKLGGLTVEELTERAARLLEEDPSLETGEGGLLTRLLSQTRSRQLNAADIRTLLWLAGVHAEVISRGSWYARLDPETTSHRVLDVLRTRRSDWRLEFELFRDVLVVTERHSSEDARPHTWPLHLASMHYGARGDAHYSAGANGSFSYLPSGQSFISHLAGPPGAGPAGTAADTGGTIRRDFSDLAFFSGSVRTDAQGRATVRLELPDSLTNWRVVVTAIDGDTNVGRQAASFRTFKPVMVWPMLPRTFTQGDRVELYASVHNRSDDDQLMTVSIQVDGGAIHGSREKSVLVKARSHRPVYWTFEPRTAGFCEILMTARCEAGSDGSLKRLPVERCAVEEVVTDSGFAEGTSRFVIPEGVNLDDASLEIRLAPTLAADLFDTLEYLVNYPHGCVEQTMSRFLPTLEVAKILDLHGISRPELQEKLPGYVAAGIKRLLELQQPDGGWGWIGTSQTHEMMTPYALYGLIQAEDSGYEIGRDGAIDRGLDRLQGFIHSMGEEKAADRVYCMYVYSLRRPLRDEWWTWIEDLLPRDGLSDYAAALALEMAARTPGRDALADHLAEALAGRARSDHGRVYWTTAGFSRWGDDPGEITAAALKALVRHDVRSELVPGILAYFASTKRGDRWKSTKDTAMILFALCDYLARVETSPLEQSASVLAINDGDSRRVVFAGSESRTLRIPGSELHPGENHVRFLNEAPGVLYRLVFRYRREGAEIESREQGIEVTRRFWLLDENGRSIRVLRPGDSVPRGAYLASEVVARHALDQPMRYILVTNPRPSGSEVLPQNDVRFRPSATSFVLREDKTRAVLWHHESTGARIRDACVFHAELAGEYFVPPASAELMYEPDTRGHSGMFHLRVVEE